MSRPSLQVMADYVSGQKVIELRLTQCQREMDALKVTNLSYDVVRADSYRQGLTKLRTSYTKGKAAFQPIYVKANGKPLVRPLTFQETIDAKVNAYESGNKALFNTSLSTSTGIVYEGTSKFKIVQLSEELVTLPRGANKPVAVSNYADSTARELDGNRAKYNNLIHKSEVLEHPAWNEAVADKALLRAYTDIVFAELNAVHTEKAMGFWLRNDPTKDSLSALVIDLLLGCYSVANGLDDLDAEARFIRVGDRRTGPIGGSVPSIDVT